VLWNGGASFGGVISFIFADLIVLPILDIYRRYYGFKVAAVLAILFYAAMVGAGYVIELLFGALRLIPASRSATVMPDAITLNYTTWLNVVAIVASLLLFWRFVRTGGRRMLREMSESSGAGHGHAHHHHR